MEESTYLEELKEKLGFYGVSQPVQEILQTIRMIAPTDLSVLIQGESGTGKEVVANAIHQLSKRRNKPLVSVNCGAIPEGILESELFGHEKGSFTGAIAQRKGYFEAADGGTIFLDEIGEMPLNTQVKLLRVLETSEIMRVGGTTPIKVDVRVIAASNKNLEQAVANNEFRRDLYFRLKAITIFIPPLRKRKEDIPVLVKKFADEYVKKNQIFFKGFSPEALEALKEYDWPGNIRELKNFVETAITLNRGEIIHSSYVRQVLNLDHRYATTDNLPVPLNKTPDQAERELIYRTLISLKLDITELKQMIGKLIQTQMDWMKHQMPHTQEETPSAENSQEIKPTSISAMERELIKETLKRFNGNRRKTAKALQISERTLYRKLHEYGLS
ncbi:sigma-54 interaction domain-containing protein [Caldithrix abyssi]|uniref:Regulatory protein, Fis family n=1 Tax=Caldithrix abyssi DSM 13497 TaxID=880073 RepID=H1XW83_CALAY|nr:sigma-54 dependent transcriptional regulator [Caldithrix abyssi]APF19043.1 regulatory protein, Fis family [Caldithrix abyssi DSM 13497]EHO42988.1 sigma54 specific transcriptional regulator, Fis family [Caldithrix abyssi DSM 13497]